METNELIKGILLGVLYSVIYLIIVRFMPTVTLPREISTAILIVATGFAMGYWPKWLWPKCNRASVGSVILGFVSTCLFLALVAVL